MSTQKTIIAHEGDVNCVALGQATGTVFATGGEDRLVNLWMYGGKNPKVTLGPFQSGVTACRFNMYEDKLLGGNTGGTVILFDLNNQRNEATWSAHRSVVNDLCFHTQNSNMILTCGYDGKVNVLSKSQRHPVQWYANHRGSANSIDISPDGKLVASGGADKTVRVFDLAMSKELFKFQCHEDAVTCVRFHPTEPILASCGLDRAVHFYDVSLGKEIQVSFPLDSHSIDLIRFAPEDPVLLSASTDFIRLLGWEPAQIYGKIPFGAFKPRDLCVAQNEITIASTEKDRVIITKRKTDGLQPFTNSKNKNKQQPKHFFDDIPNPSNGGRSTPRLIDMESLAKKSRSMSECSTGDEPEPEITPRGRLLRPGSVGNKDSEQKSMSHSSSGSVYNEFRKDRTQFMTFMNERYSRFARINEALDSQSLLDLLKEAAESTKQSSEILSIIAMKPEAITLDHASYIMQIAAIAIKSNPDLAVSTIETMMQSFGAFVRATLATPSSGVDLAFDERKQKCNAFTSAFRQVAPALKQISNSSSESSDAARDLIEQWRVFLK
ncbi:hypothetical protein TVAG_130970 [Trichomonas vaginalis G3]|uniref:Katanin p80 subunit C-terminal domain-containing protein n=1 Tax=Trichomonas vaginalis (strain ATCC PRA-98 / G3) TaxID=412133 RepID=A2EPM0_TRIV3|nr:microtubule severing [Trichomonas vaginalis G3]EAY05363.1 hypothetical protein TVAG_130970 [Trichomonas vaginalis G3]KAI5524046.1 microtubule severing [Trichomonas vaginalis G3]|eukprot:XP_001317586.1 hypothetical protein [Trichomonas vaginalis G3]